MVWSHRVAITYDQVKSVAAELYGACLMKIPDDTKDALGARMTARRTTAPEKSSR